MKPRGDRHKSPNIPPSFGDTSPLRLPRVHNGESGLEDPGGGSEGSDEPTLTLAENDEAKRQ